MFRFALLVIAITIGSAYCISTNALSWLAPHLAHVTDTIGQFASCIAR